MWTSLFSARGRLRRSTYWTVIALSLAGFASLFGTIEAAAGRGATLALYPPLFWLLACAGARRYHDLDKSPAWLLLLLVPILGPLWVMLETGLRRGTAGDNRHGPDPRSAGLDYLTVDIR